MSYYAAGDYGDYYEGDLFGVIKGIGRTIGGAATGFVSGGLTGAVRGGVRGLTGGGSRVPQIGTRMPPPPGRGSMSGINIGGNRGITIGKRIGPGEVVGFPEMPGVELPRRRRRMNYNNPRALARANRRREGFIRNVKKSLKGSGMSLKRSGGGAPRKLGCGCYHACNCKR